MIKKGAKGKWSKVKKRKTKRGEEKQAQNAEGKASEI